MPIRAMRIVIKAIPLGVPIVAMPVRNGTNAGPGQCNNKGDHENKKRTTHGGSLSSTKDLIEQYRRVGRLSIIELILLLRKRDARTVILSLSKDAERSRSAFPAPRYMQIAPRSPHRSL
jgi:hypothetical protein